VVVVQVVVVGDLVVVGGPGGCWWSCGVVGLGGGAAELLSQESRERGAGLGHVAGARACCRTHRGLIRSDSCVRPALSMEFC
jgi:hypothetical protein